MQSTETSNPVSEIEDLENDNTLAKFVTLILKEANKAGAIEIIMVPQFRSYQSRKMWQV